MKTSAKFLFEKGYATGEKPIITMVEHERRRADAKPQADRKGFTPGRSRPRMRSPST